jgi:hypothetical protein
MPYVENIKEMYGVINKENLVEELKKHLILLLKMMKPWKILLHLHLKNTMMKTLLTSPLKTKHKKKSSIHEDSSHLILSHEEDLILPWKTLMKTLMVRVPMHLFLLPMRLRVW